MHSWATQDAGASGTPRSHDLPGERISTLLGRKQGSGALDANLRRSMDLDLKQQGSSDLGSVLHSGREEDFSDWDEEVREMVRGRTRKVQLRWKLLAAVFACSLSDVRLLETMPLRVHSGAFVIVFRKRISFLVRVGELERFFLRKCSNVCHYCSTRQRHTLTKKL